MQKRERVCCRADTTNAIALGGFQVGSALEPADDRRPGSRYRGALMGAPRAHIHAGATVRGNRHTRGR